MKNKRKEKSTKIEVNRHTILGFISIIALIIEFIGIALVLSGRTLYGIWIIDFVLIFAFLYTIHKTLIKRKKLRNLEWGIVFILTLYVIMMWLVGIIFGIFLLAMEGYF